jgi:hypothetical protein
VFGSIEPPGVHELFSYEVRPGLLGAEASTRRVLGGNIYEEAEALMGTTTKSRTQMFRLDVPAVPRA